MRLYFSRTLRILSTLVSVIIFCSYTFGQIDSNLLDIKGKVLPLEIIINGFKNDIGQVIIDIYFNKSSFENETPEFTHYLSKSKVVNNEIRVFLQLPKQILGIAIIDDNNMDKKINRNFIGFPLEGFGFSNIELKKLRKPKFDEISFKHDGLKKIRIELYKSR